MAGVSGRARMIDSTEELIGGTCEEAILMQQRPKWLYPALIVTVVVMAVLFSAVLANLPVIVQGAIVGAVVGGFIAFNTKYWILARGADGKVYFLKSSKMSAKALEVVSSQKAPVKYEVKKGPFAFPVTFDDGERYLVARPFVSRMERICAR